MDKGKKIDAGNPSEVSEIPARGSSKQGELDVTQTLTKDRQQQGASSHTALDSRATLSGWGREKLVKELMRMGQGQYSEEMVKRVLGNLDKRGGNPFFETNTHNVETHIREIETTEPEDSESGVTHARQRLELAFIRAETAQQFVKGSFPNEHEELFPKEAQEATTSAYRALGAPMRYLNGEWSYLSISDDMRKAAEEMQKGEMRKTPKEAISGVINDLVGHLQKVQKSHGDLEKEHGPDVRIREAQQNDQNIQVIEAKRERRKFEESYVKTRTVQEFVKQSFPNEYEELFPEETQKALASAQDALGKHSLVPLEEWRELKVGYISRLHGKSKEEIRNGVEPMVDRLKADEKSYREVDWLYMQGRKINEEFDWNI